MDWTATYMLPHLVTHSTYMRSYILIKNVIFLEYSPLHCVFPVKKTLAPQPTISGIFDSISNNSFFESNKIFNNHLEIHKYKKFININNLIA